MKSYTFAALCVATITPALASQTIYSPNHFARAEANTYAYGGIGTVQTPSVLLSIHEELRGTPRTIRSVSLRREGVSITQDYPASTWLVTAYASTGVTSAAAPSATLAANHGADKKTVAQFALVQLPASTFRGPASPFEFKIPFTTPFQFGGNGPLCLEIQVQSRSHTHYYYFDYATGPSTNPSPEYLRWGTGCKATGLGSPMNLQPGASANWPGAAFTLSYYGSTMPANGLVSILLGGSRTTLNGLPLPFELPMTAAAASGPCSIYNDILISVPALTTAAGNLTFNLGLSASASLNGASLFGQVYALDPTANPWGVVTSNGVQHQIIAPYSAIPIGTVYSDASVGPTGTVLANQGYVMKFDS